MSYEKRMKDLLGRLVAMSPEPPPYPEETPMATSEPPRKRMHPALVFAGAAALVAALAIPVILLTGDEPPVAGGTTTTTTIGATSTSQPGTSSTTTGQSTTTTTPSTTSTTVAATTWQGTIYLYQTPENSFFGNPALVPIAVEVIDPSTAVSPDGPFTEALAAIASDLPPGLENAIPADVQLLSTGESSDTIVADMSESFLDGAGGLLGDVTMLNQIVYTLTQSDPDKQVQFTVNGQPVEAFGSEGMVLTDPVDRDSFLTESALIFLTEPIMEVENVFVVSGRSNTFEAALTMRVIDSSGATIHEEPVQATSGSGIWGEFGVGVATDLITPGETSIQLFEYSPEDGEPSNLITIPVFENGIWSVSLD